MSVTIRGSGQIVQQIISTTLTTAFSSSTKGSWVAVTGLSAAITPSNSANRILVMVQLSTGDGGNNYNRLWRVTRNGTSINPSTVGLASLGAGSFAANIISTTSGSNGALVTIPFTFLDAPSSTSALTYQVEFIADTRSVQNTFVNRTVSGGSDNSDTTSNITLMEIAYA
jgi:hypothetical protein